MEHAPNLISVSARWRWPPQFQLAVAWQGIINQATLSHESGEKRVMMPNYVDGANDGADDAANYDHANNYGYVSAEHDDHSAETHCTFNNELC